MRSTIFILVALVGSMSFAASVMPTRDLKIAFGRTKGAAQIALNKATLKAIESACDLPSGARGVIVSEKVLGTSTYGGSYIPVGTPSCSDQDLPCSAQHYVFEGAEILKTSKLTIRFNNSVDVKVEAGWDYDLPMPQPDVQITKSANCR